MPPVQSTNTVIVLSELTARQRLVLSTDDTSALSNSSSSSMLSVLSALANTCTQPLSKRERQLNLLLCRLEPRGRRELTSLRDGETN